MKKVLYGLVASILLAGLFMGCAPATPETRNMELIAGKGTSTRIGMGIADILNKNHPTLRVSVTEISALAATIAESLNRNPEEVLILSRGVDYIPSQIGWGPWEGKPAPDVKFINGIHKSQQGFMTLNPNIKSLADLEGKRLALVRGAATRAFAEALFEVLGIEVDIKSVGFMDNFNSLRDGLTDAAMYLAGTPQMAELLQVKEGKVYLIPVPGELIGKAQELLGWDPEILSPDMIRAESLPTQTGPVEGYSQIVYALLVREGADEKQIYEITKVLAENSSLFKDYWPALHYITPETMVKFLPIKSSDEIHPGALKYYEEVGLWPSAFEGN